MHQMAFSASRVKKLIKESIGTKFRVSKSAVTALNDILTAEGKKLAKNADGLAKAAKRVTIMDGDIAEAAKG
ncbi:MAG: histone-like protein [Candidatus Hodarchaeota archaeon]